MDRMMRCVFEEHRLVLSSYVLEELAFVVERKFPTKTRAIDAFLSGISFELVYTVGGKTSQQRVYSAFRKLYFFFHAVPLNRS